MAILSTKKIAKGAEKSPKWRQIAISGHTDHDLEKYSNIQDFYKYAWPFRFNNPTIQDLASSAARKVDTKVIKLLPKVAQKVDNSF